MSIGLHDLLVVEQHPINFIAFANMGDVMPRMDGWPFVRNECEELVTRRNISQAWKRSSHSGGRRRRTSSGFFASIIGMAEQPFDCTVRIASLQFFRKIPNQLHHEYSRFLGALSELVERGIPYR